MKIGIIGNGYVGNAVKNGFESKGYLVKTYDKFKKSDVFETIALCDFIFICVPTPSNSDGSICLIEVDEVFTRFMLAQPQGIIIIKSTVLPGTAQAYQNKYPDLKIVSNPEFLTHSTAEYDFLHPDKIIIGYTRQSESAVNEVTKLYSSFRAPIKIVKSEEAEMSKYMVNAYYYTRVIFANEIYDICQALGVDYEKVRECFEMDKRVAPGHFDVFHGGYRGVGGSCLPKDLCALISVTGTALFRVLRAINRRLMK